MKTSALKILIKEAVKEAIQEELKEILLEAVKTPKVISHTPVLPLQVTENINTIPTNPPTPTMSAEDKRIAYRNILGDTGATINSSNAQAFQPQVGMDTANGTLPAGEVDMSQIMGLIGSK